MRRAELAAAVALLTRLPAAWLLGGCAWPGAAASVWAYPVVGALVGGVGGLAVWLSGQAGLPPSLGAVLAITVMLLLTGGLHEDGLADTADGFGGGGTIARKLEIMRDSRIGSYGALALILAIAIRGVALAAIPPWTCMPALIAAGGLGRGAIIVVLVLLRPVRTDGAASPLRHVRPGAATAGLLFAAASSAFLPLRAALPCIACAALAAAGAATLARQQVGGYTGDVLGAAEVVAECIVLCAVVGTGG